MNKFRIIAITPESVIENEPGLITEMLRGSVDVVHLRHPGASESIMAQIIDAVTPALRSRIRIHSHFQLIERYGLAGAHLNSRNNFYSGRIGTLTRSCHRLEELKDCDKYTYSTLSPIYPSISKPGYVGQFSLPELSTQIAGKNVIALGGVIPDKLRELRAAGFIGAAMLGWIWQNDLTIDAKNKIIKEALCCNS